MTNPNDGRYGYAQQDSYAYAPPQGSNGNGVHYGAQAYQEPGRFLYGPAPEQPQAPAPMSPVQQAMPQLISSAGEVAAEFMRGHVAEKVAREQQRLMQFQAAPLQGLLWLVVPLLIGGGVVYLAMRGRD